MEGDLAAVEAYKSSGGDIARQLTSDEVRLLNRPSAFDDGFTLVHLAIRFQRQDMLAVLLEEVSREKQQIVNLSGITHGSFCATDTMIRLNKVQNIEYDDFGQFHM